MLNGFAYLLDYPESFVSTLGMYSEYLALVVLSNLAGQNMIIAL